MLKELLKNEVTLLNIKKTNKIDLNKFDVIIIGGSIHAGNIQSAIKKYCQNNIDILLHKKLGLFVCCMEKDEKAHQQFQNAYPKVLIDHAAATSIFGGEFNFERMNFLEGFIIKKIAKTDKSISNILKNNIKEFSEKIKA